MIIAISIIILLIFIFYKDNYETFKYFNTVNDSTPKSYLNLDNFFRIFFPSDKYTSSIYQNRFNFIPTTINDKTLDNDDNLSTNYYNDFKSNNCCLVKKELDNNNFKYTYTKYNNKDCNINNFELDQNNQLFFDGINEWDNSQCKNDNDILGSCQHYNFECIDFVSKDTCDLYNKKVLFTPLKNKITFKWSAKPCYNKN